MNDEVNQIQLPSCWRCLVEPYQRIGGQGSWMFTALVEEPTTCPVCSHWSIRQGGGAWWKGWWNNWWSALPATVLLMGFYGVPLPALSSPLAHDGAKDQVVATAPVNPSALHLSTTWAMADPCGAGIVDGGTGRDELVLGGGQLPTTVSSPPLMAGGAGLTEETPFARPHQGGDLPGQSLSPLVPTAQSDRATLSGEEAPSPKVKKARKKRDRPGPGMEIMDDVFAQDQVQRLIDDWLVPMLVEIFIRERIQTGEEG